MDGDELVELDQRGGMSLAPRRDPLTGRFSGFPWWLVAIVFILVAVAFFIYSTESYRQAFEFILRGISITIQTTLYAYSISMIIGLIMGLGRVSRNLILRNIARFYVELIRGIPILVLIFTIAYVVVVEFAGLIGINPRDVPFNTRAVIALAITYGAFSAEIFRAGIQSIGSGQMEAARSLGMSYGQAMRYVILPQAIRNVLPALGNDFIAMLKDSSLVSVLAVRDITQVARLHAGSTFRFRESYLILSTLYLSMTLVLSGVVQWMERRMRVGRK